MNLIRLLLYICFCLYLSLASKAFSRSLPDQGQPKVTSETSLSSYRALCRALHNIGKLHLSVGNNGTLDTAAEITTRFICQPGIYGKLKTSGVHARYYFYGAFWIGAVVGGDTLVSTGYDGWEHSGYEFMPDEAPFGLIEHRSIIDPLKPEFEGAISEQDYLAKYTDTVTGLMYDGVDGRLHQPLGIEVSQNSYAWSYDYADDFVLFDYTIKNIGTELLQSVYMGFYVDGDVGSFFPGTQVPDIVDDAQDDILGFLPEHKTSYGGCDWIDTINLAWFADNDADFDVASDTIASQPDITGVCLIRTPLDELNISFNWWTSHWLPTLDYGPQTNSRYRSHQHGGTGTPAGDLMKYHYLSNGEFDFDQIFTKAIIPGDSIWAYPNQIIADYVSKGGDSRYLLSFGPFNISPGQELPISFSYVRGSDFHTDPNNAPDNLTGENYNPKRFMRNVHFDNIVKNSLWASWIYDNPGVDSDGDGYYGKSRLCCFDSAVVKIDSSYNPYDTVWAVDGCREVFYEGDGIPDYSAASPPPAPKMWVEPKIGEIRVRFNGTYSENTPDIFTQTIDFEGYRVHMSLDSRESSYTLLASYDKENYDKFVWDTLFDEWKLVDTPFTARGLACLYGDSCGANIDPLTYTSSRPYFMPGFPDSIFYFVPHEYNMSVLGITTPIRKVYPHEPYPSTMILDDAYSHSLTDDGYFKYFEYEYTIKNILPTVQYYVSVTVFDYGSANSGLMALETSKTLNAQRVFALSSVSEVEKHGLPVYTYPNPYRINGNYRADGFEGRDSRLYIPERDRRIHFVNLPAKCTIGIYSLDGDLVRELKHDYDPTAPDASHDEWNMITRNTQAVTTGIYFWTVTDENGNTQIGKFVIIK